MAAYSDSDGLLVVMEPDISSNFEGNEAILKNGEQEHDEKYMCHLCNKLFMKSHLLQKHCKRVHDESIIHMENRGKLKCAFKSECKSLFPRTAVYRSHLEQVHGVKIEKIVIRFDSYEEFLCWKTEEETAASAKFIKGGKVEKLLGCGSADINKMIYNCSRTGEHIIKGTRRKVTQKMSACCPAKMDVIYSSDRVVVVYFKTHVGHGNLSEVFKTSEAQRLKRAAIRRQKKYEEAKEVVKQKVDNFLKVLDSDKLTLEYLNSVSQKIDDLVIAAVLSQKPVTEDDKSVLGPVLEVRQIVETDLNTTVDSIKNETDEKNNIVSSSCSNNVSLLLTSQVKAPSRRGRRRRAAQSEVDPLVLDHCYDLSARLGGPKTQLPWDNTVVEFSEKSSHGYGKVLAVSDGAERRAFSVNAYVLQNHFVDLLINDDNWEAAESKKKIQRVSEPSLSSLKTSLASLKPVSEEQKQELHLLWNSFREK